MKSTMNLSEQNYYLSIDDIPLWNYRKGIEGKVNYCRREWSDKPINEDDCRAWEMVYDDYLRTFGLGDKYEEYTYLQMELIELNCELILENSLFLINKIKRLEQEMQNLLSNDKGVDMDDCIVFVSKWMGTIINEKQVTAKMFFKMLDNLIKDGKKNNQSGDN